MIESLKKLNLSQNLEECKWSGAVNFLFVRDHILLIKRSEQMPTHAGQLAFAGGHRNKSEVNPIDTALRELNEETAIDLSKVNTIGILGSVNSSSISKIIPVISYIDADPKILVNELKSNGEWDEAILVPIEYFRDMSRWSYGISTRENKEYKINFCSISNDAFISTNNDSEFKSHLLWGATAQMMWNFFKLRP
jgi:8-oxo-dGTP pyrophosphatase MutT (NUDIX family)